MLPPCHSLQDLFFEPSVQIEFDGAVPPLTDEMVANAERRLGFRLPATYIEVLRIRNGGMLRRCLYRPDANADFQIWMPTIFGIGGERGINSPAPRFADNDTHDETMNEFLIRMWGYLQTGVVIAHVNHGGFQLDYRDCGPSGEPSVVYIDAERHPKIAVHPVCENFAALISGLTEFKADGESFWSWM